MDNNNNNNRKSSFYDDFMVVQTFADTAAAVIDYDYQMRKKKKKVDHRLLPREAKRKFKHDEAVDCIRRDYLGPTALFKGKEFDMMFRISRARFDRMMVDFANSGNSFYSGKTDCAGLKGASLEAKILLPLKTLAFGVAPHAFSDYFQMSQSLARECCRQFNKQIISVYKKEYLRVPTQADLKALSTLHEAVHEVPGMFGSLDCMHTFWKNCPVAWHGSYKNGKYSGPSIILEAVADHHMWLWHASYGYAGTLFYWRRGIQGDVCFGGWNLPPVQSIREGHETTCFEEGETIHGLACGCQEGCRESVRSSSMEISSLGKAHCADGP